jgi:FAD synthetase
VNFFEARKTLKAAFIACRLTDAPIGKFKFFQECDHGWPNITRVHPILHFSYSQIWDYITANDVPYCSLYDQGYSSLGPKNKTRKNPKLIAPDGSAIHPSKLSDGLLERNGRI